MNKERKGEGLIKIVGNEVTDRIVCSEQKLSDEEFVFALWTLMFERFFDSYRCLSRKELIPRTFSNDLHAISLKVTDLLSEFGYTEASAFYKAKIRLDIPVFDGFVIINHNGYDHLLDVAHVEIQKTKSKSLFVKRMVAQFPHPSWMAFKWIANVKIALSYNDFCLDVVKEAHPYFAKYQKQLKDALGKDPIVQIARSWTIAKKRYDKALKKYHAENQRKMKVNRKARRLKEMEEQGKIKQSLKKDSIDITG